MHCNLRPSEPRQPFPTLNTTPCQVLKLLNLSVAELSRFCRWYITWRFDLWPWTFAVYCLWYDETLCQIWTQSSNPRRSYSDFNIWPYDLEHVLRVALGSGIIFTKFKFRQLIRAWIIALLMLIRYFTLWPWPLTRWPWKFVVHQASHYQNLYEVLSFRFLVLHGGPKNDNFKYVAFEKKYRGGLLFNTAVYIISVTLVNSFPLVFSDLRSSRRNGGGVTWW